jgi:hypothetical protein
VDGPVAAAEPTGTGAAVTAVTGPADAMVVMGGHPGPDDVACLSDVIVSLQRDQGLGVLVELSGLRVCRLELLDVLVRARRRAVAGGLAFQVAADGRGTAPDVRRLLALAGLVAYPV